MASYYTADSTNITFHFGSGTFHTLGAYGPGGGSNLWFLLDGWKLQGTGIDRTILFQDSTSNPTGYPLLTMTANSNANNQSVQGMTIDCGYFRDGATYSSSWSAITLEGANATVRNVKVVHAGSSNGAECFAIFIVSYSGEPIINDAVIDSSQVMQCGSNVSALTIANHLAEQTPPVFATGGRITNCTVDGAVNGAGAPGGFNGGTIDSNTITNCAHGIYHDQIPTKNAVISNNTMSGCGNAVLFNAGAILQQNPAVINNTFASESGIGFEASGSPGVVNALISGNRLITSGSGYYCVFLYGASVANTHITNNIIDPTLPFENTATNTYTCGNVSPNGDPLPYMPDTCTN